MTTCVLARVICEWFATGGEYLRDKDGFYHHRGRSDDMLKVSGLWVSPSEIEDALAGIPMIAEAAAVLSESAAGLSEIVLYVVARSSADSEAALAAAREQLARKLPAFKVPRQYALNAELPRIATGKIQRHKLRAELQRRRDVSRTAREPVANAPQAVSGDLKPRQDK